MPTKKASATLAITIALPADKLDKKLMVRVGHAVKRFLDQHKDVQAQLCAAAASADDTLFPHEFEVTVDFDERDVHLEDG